MHDHFLESWMSGDGSPTVGHDVNNVLEVLHVGLRGSKAALGAIVVPLQCFMD